MINLTKLQNLSNKVLVVFRVLIAYGFYTKWFKIKFIISSGLHKKVLIKIFVSLKA